MEYVTLPDEEILSLKTILVKSNRQIVGVRFEPGFSGAGGTNTSGFSADEGKEYEYTAEELDGKQPICVEWNELCALVNDVLYFRRKNHNGEMRTLTLDCGQSPLLCKAKASLTTPSPQHVLFCF